METSNSNNQATTVVAEKPQQQPAESQQQQQQQQKPKKVLCILRGISGSGKSTLAKQIINEYGAEYGRTGLILSTDDYFIRRETGNYEFNPMKLGKAHEWNQRRAADAMRKGIQVIIIDNTNTCKWEAKPYVEEGINNGYEIIIREPTTPWAKNADELAKRNVHNVPVESIRNMLMRWENDFTVENILKSQAPRRRGGSRGGHRGGGQHHGGDRRDHPYNNSSGRGGGSGDTLREDNRN